MNNRNDFSKRFNGKLVFILILILAIVGTSSVSAAAIDGVIGFRWNTSDSSPRLYQIDSDGTVIPNGSAAWFNDHLPWSGMKTVVVNATNATPVLYGTANNGTGLDLSGQYGDVMVEIPRFYTCSTYVNGNFSYWISPDPQDALHYTVHSMFNQRGTGTAAGTAAPYYYVGRYDANDGGSSKLQSATGKSPLVSQTIGTFRTYAENKGSGWGITNIWTFSGLRQLFYTEMVTLNSQTAWTGSRGIVDDTTSAVGARPSGADGINTAIYAINATGNGTGTDGYTPVSYRGIENLWGNVWQFQDGVAATKLGTNVTNSTGLGLTGQATTFQIPMDANDVQSVGALPSATGDSYQTNWTNTDVARPLFLPSAYVGGSETTYLSDYYWKTNSEDAANPNILFSGGPWYDVGRSGVGSLVADNIASFSHAAIGARLEFRFSAPGASFSSKNISVATNSTSQGWAGVAPFTMVFNDTSSKTPTSWSWGRNNLTVTAWEQFSTTNNATQAFVAGNWSVNLTATNSGGSGISGITWVNVSAAAPTITSISPTSGTTAGGTAVTITGTSFTGATAVTFGGTAATSYTVVSATQITAVTPVKAAGAVNVVVTTTGGTATGSGAYTYVTPAPTPAPNNGGGDSDSPAAPVAPAAPVVPGISSTSEVNVGGNSAVTHVAITGTGISGAIVTGTVVSGPGLNTAPPTLMVYEYVDIIPARYTTISEAVISFTVPVSWLTERQLTPKNVIMYHLVGQTWVALPTTLVKVENEVAYYTAVSPGFSRFAITGQFNITSATPLATLTPAEQTYGDLVPTTSVTKTPTPVAAVTARPVTTQTTAIPAVSQPAPALPLQTIAIVGGVIVVLVAGGFLIRRWWIRRQNPALFRNYD